MSKSETFSINKKVSRLLASERKAKGITQAGLAQKLKKPQSYVSKYENGQRQLTVADLTAICKVIKLKPADFFSMLDKAE